MSLTPLAVKVLTDPRLFIETFFKIIDKKGRLVPFWLNNVQEEYYDYLMKNHWKPYVTASGVKKYRFQGIRETELKARQYGGSTFIEGIIAFDTLTNEGTNSRIFCQDYEFSKLMLGKFKLFYVNMPKDIRPELGYNTTGQMTFPEIMSTIRAEKPGASESVSRKQGRSTTIHNIHVSELAEWVNAKITMLGLTEAVAKDGNIFCESSPKKVGDYFHIQYTQGKDEKSEWHSRFVPWFAINEYNDNVTAEESEEILNSLSEREQLLINLHGLSASQLAWRRRKVSEKLNSEKDFLREYPEDDVECFEAEADLTFPENVRKITCQVREAIPGHIHSIGVDIGGGGTYSDDSSIVVIDTVTMEQVYQQNLIIDPEDLPKVVYEVWKKYPGIVGFESNGDVGLAALKVAYKITDWQKFLFSNNTARGGYYTGVQKKACIFALREALKLVAAGLPGLKISSQQIVKEMNWFQDLGNGKLGSPERTSNDPNNRMTDDSIMGLMISHAMIEYIDKKLMDEFNKIFGKGIKRN